MALADEKRPNGLRRIGQRREDEVRGAGIIGALDVAWRRRIFAGGVRMVNPHQLQARSANLAQQPKKFRRSNFVGRRATQGIHRRKNPRHHAVATRQQPATLLLPLASRFVKQAGQRLTPNPNRLAHRLAVSLWDKTARKKKLPRERRFIPPATGRPDAFQAFAAWRRRNVGTSRSSAATSWITSETFRAT